MKKLLLVSLLIISTGIIKAQKHDNIWLFGYESNSVSLAFGGSVLDFSEDSLEIYFDFREMNLDMTNASICDEGGNLLFYTNGIYIANVQGDTLENGEGLNPGEFAEDFSFYGYRRPQTAIILPKPESTNLYYLFHTSTDYPNDTLSVHSPRFYFTLIDMELGGGLGAVVEKNEIIIDEPLYPGALTATRHANGRDWWLLVNPYETNSFYRILLTPEGIINYGLQNLGDYVHHGLGQATFSPDGSKYVLYTLETITLGNYLYIYDFDRCTGELSNPIVENIIDGAYSAGVAISPNSRYLYVPSYEQIYQYDLVASDIIGSKETIGIYDGFETASSSWLFLPTRYFSAQLGPDDKIYINCPGSLEYIHVINQPDNAGEACEILQHHLELPSINNSSLPNFPNYRLGPIEGSPCDTL